MKNKARFLAALLGLIAIYPCWAGAATNAPAQAVRT